MDIRNARVTLVHVNDEPEAQHRLITGEAPGFRMGDRVLVAIAKDQWRRGHVDHRAPSCPGGVVMVTLDRG